MTARILVNGVEGDRVSALDRGMAYGDGLFETIRAINGVAPLWARHMARLHDGCARLGLPAPEIETLADEFARVVEGSPDAVVKIILTRGIGERGYAPSVTANATRIVAAFPAPRLPADWYRDGIRVRCCALRLAAQPRLAGIKHLNRLEQVLARAEWSDADVIEGLTFDHADNLVSATAANVFAAIDGVLRTPPVDACGVAGVLRGALLEALPDVRVQTTTKEDLMRADELFLTSSVRGVLPVRALDERALRVGRHARAAQAQWHALGFPGGDA
ncbi:MAG: Aminodeoxychorismate lyase [Rhodanobacteraceae bacterium]|jgi:4-amino-4-deoxychorismate lyase|nr:MAG: Aminodeoxychorismate lyase [Rhodanobacteraceae bacterium]